MFLSLSLEKLTLPGHLRQKHMEAENNCFTEEGKGSEGLYSEALLSPDISISAFQNLLPPSILLSPNRLTQ